MFVIKGWLCVIFRLKAISGCHAIALAAKHYSVPVSVLLLRPMTKMVCFRYTLEKIDRKGSDLKRNIIISNLSM